jgi:CheY-like chemotaxis protein
VVRDALQIGGDAGTQVLLTNPLQPESWNVHHAPSNASALEFVEARHYDLIVTSQKTSGKEDIEFLRNVKRLRSQARLIILADESTTTDVVTAMGEHAFSYFAPPFCLDELQRMIRAATEDACWNDGIGVVCAAEQRIGLNVRCDYESADRALQFLEEIEALPNPERREMATACRELLYNAIEYGGKFDPANHVEIDHQRSHDTVTCRITDQGPGFTCDNIPHAAIANPADAPAFQAVR